MNAHQKLRMSAAAVIVNGLLALGAMTPSPAPAAEDAVCSDNNYHVIARTCVECEEIPGCTVRSPCLCAGHLCHERMTICFYDPAE
jgi:hypothetical protein